MLITNQQILETLNILSAWHQKVIDEFQRKAPSDALSLDEVNQTLRSTNALSTYNFFKPKYQPSV